MHKLLSAIGRPRHILRFKGTKAGDTVQSGAKLRILPVGDSITVGFGSERNGGDGNGYRGRLKESLCSKSTGMPHSPSEAGNTNE